MLTLTWKRTAELIVVLLCATALKAHYSTASVNQLRWILAPTTLAVELVTGARFQFESYAGYISSDRTFVIAASCAGINFLIAAFLMLTLRELWRHRSQAIAWKFIPTAAVFAYLATLVANTVRISTALQLQGTRFGLEWFSPNQMHRFEGIFIYFGFLLLLFTLSERMTEKNLTGSQNRSRLMRRWLFPLLIYYATTVAIPLVNGGYRQGPGSWEHLLFVLLTPLLLILPLTVFCFLSDQLQSRQRHSLRTR